MEIEFNRLILSFQTCNLHKRRLNEITNFDLHKQQYKLVYFHSIQFLTVVTCSANRVFELSIVYIFFEHGGNASLYYRDMRLVKSYNEPQYPSILR